MDRKKLRHWIKQLQRFYDDQLRDLIYIHQIFGKIRKLSERKPTELADYFHLTYLAYMGASIRKMSDSESKIKKQKNLSLIVLLEDLKKNGSMLTRDWFKSRYPKFMIKTGIADRDFSKISNKSAAAFSEKMIITDINAIKKVAAPMRRLTDKAIAHTEMDRRKKGRPKWRDIDKAVKLYVDIFQKYRLLLKGAPLLDIDKPYFKIEKEFKKLFCETDLH